MNVQRYLNASYSLFTYALKRYTAIPLTPPLPPAVSVEVSSVCNLTCPECVTGRGLTKRRNTLISLELATEIASQLRDTTLSVWLSFQGEPMMHPQFFSIAALFAGLHPVIATNAHFLDMENCIRLADSPLEEIIISYDGVTAGSYGYYRRGGNHELVREGITRAASVFRERRSGPKITIQFLVHRGNEHEVAAAASFAVSIGASFRIKSIQVLDISRAGEWLPDERRWSRYVSDKHGGWKITGLPSRGCLRMWRSAVITTDGDVIPCCYDKERLHIMGNLNELPFTKIWRGERYSSFRDRVMTSRSLVDICSECPQGLSLFFNK